MALPTVAQVKNTPLSPALKAVFASVDDAAVQELIDNCASFWGSAEVKRHTLRDEAVKLGAAHLLYTQLQAEGVIAGGGGGGGAGVLSGISLEGVGSKSWSVQALSPEEVMDWLKQKSPFSNKLLAILRTFPPGIAVTGWPTSGLSSGC
jgi:hypothetical protein